MLPLSVLSLVINLVCIYLVMLGRLPGTRNQKGKETERVSSVRVLFQKRTLVCWGQKMMQRPHHTMDLIQIIGGG